MITKERIVLGIAIWMTVNCIVVSLILLKRKSEQRKSTPKERKTQLNVKEMLSPPPNTHTRKRDENIDWNRIPSLRITVGVTLGIVKDFLTFPKFPWPNFIKFPDFFTMLIISTSHGHLLTFRTLFYMFSGVSGKWQQLSSHVKIWLTDI